MSSSTHAQVKDELTLRFEGEDLGGGFGIEVDYADHLRRQVAPHIVSDLLPVARRFQFWSCRRLGRGGARPAGPPNTLKSVLILILTGRSFAEGPLSVCKCHMYWARLRKRGTLVRVLAADGAVSEVGRRARREQFANAIARRNMDILWWR